MKKNENHKARGQQAERGQDRLVSYRPEGWWCVCKRFFVRGAGWFFYFPRPF